MSIDLLIFDLDGVLVESELILAHTLSERFAGIGIDAPPDLILRRFHYVPYQHITRLLAQEQAIDIPEGFMEGLPQIYADAMEEHLEAVPGAHEALTALTLPKCIASGSRPENLRRKLELVGLLSHFDPHLFSAFDVPRPKPAPDVFEKAARTMGTAPARCLVVEDAVVGIEAARAAGMHAVGFCGGGHCHDGWGEALREAGAHEVLEDLRLLPSYLAGLNDRPVRTFP